MQFIPTLVVLVTISVDAKYGYGHGGLGHGHRGHHGYNDPGYGSHVGYHPHAIVAKVPAVAEKVVDYHVR